MKNQNNKVLQIMDIFSNSFNMSWKIINKIEMIMVFPIVRLLFLFNNIRFPLGGRFYGIPIIQKHRKSTILFDRGLQVRSSRLSNPLGVNHPTVFSTLHPESLLMIGKNFAITGGAICVSENISIGNNVSIGANTTVIDTNFHPLNSIDRRINPQEGLSCPVKIEDDVFIGMNCLILKGVTIGKGSVIGGCSVVTKSIPPFSIAAGNPAKVIKKIHSE